MENAAAIKACSRCGEIMELTKFGRDRRRKDGRRSQCKNCEAIYNRGYYSAHIPDYARRSREWQLSNPEKNAESVRQWRAANPGRNKETRRRSYANGGAARARRWRESHSARFLEGQRQRRASNPEKTAELNRTSHSRRRVREMSTPNTFSVVDWRALVARSPHCHWCKRPWAKNRRPTHDHVIPLAKGGSNTLENSCCACRECNSRKHSNLINPATGQLLLI
jgi:hypothetical protein